MQICSAPIPHNDRSQIRKNSHIKSYLQFALMITASILYTTTEGFNSRKLSTQSTKSNIHFICTLFKEGIIKLHMNLITPATILFTI